MKRSKRLMALAGVLAVLCAAILVVTTMQQKKEQIKTAGQIVLAVPAQDVDALRWQLGDAQLSFRKEDTGWIYEGDEAFPVDEEKLLALLEQFEAFGVSFVIEEVTDPGMYGLDTPECTITFTAGEDSYTVELGDFSKMDEERYVSLGDGNVYLARTDPMEKFDVQLSELIRHDSTLSYDQVTQIRLEGTENYTIFHDEDNAAAWTQEDVYFTSRDGQTLPLDTDRVEDWLETLTMLTLTDYVTYNATQEELGSCGLDEPELTISVDCVEMVDGEETSSTYVLYISRDPDELAAAQQAEDKGEEPEDVCAYVRVGESPIIYRISAYRQEQVMAVSYDDLRSRKVFSADFDQVSEICVTLEGEEYTLCAGEKDVWTMDDEEIDLTTLQSALESLRADGAEKFTVEGGGGKQEIALTLCLDNENHPRMEIELCRYDGSDCLARVDGETFALVSRADVVQLVEAVHEIVLGRQK